MNLNCSNQDPCPVILDSKCVIYEGENLLFIGVNTNDNYRYALQQINAKMADLILSGGITELRGDVLAIGPGEATATLATVNSTPGQYGSSTAIPKLTVDGKGRVTAITTEAVFIPSGALSFIGDVTGTGNTGSNTTLTLATVNSNIYTTNTFLKFAANAKGLITSATPVVSADITGALGFIPYNSTNPSGFISGITSMMVTNALGYTPYNSTNPAGFISGITGTMVTNALGFTPYNSSNPAGYISGINSSDVITALGFTPYNSTNPSNFISRLGLTASAPLFYDNVDGVFTIQEADATHDGYLSDTDWNTFNNKQPSGNYITDLNGEVTGSGPGTANVTLNNSAVTGKVLTGVNITGGNVTATDSILIAFGKLQNQINSLIGSSIYKGVWNAATNTPTLTSGVGTQGWYYIVNVYGTTNLDGIAEWHVGDWAIFDGVEWQKVDTTDAVVSVNGQIGAVSLTTDNIPEGSTNRYFTNTRARTALSAGTGLSYDDNTGIFSSTITQYTDALARTALTAGAGITYDNTTGSISNAAPDQLVTIGSGTGMNVTGTYPNFTVATTITQYTDALARGAISLTTTGTSGPATYNNSTGVLNIPEYQGGVTSFNTRTGAITLTSGDVTGALTYTPVTNARTLTINGETYDLTADRSWTIAGGVTSFNTRTGAITLLDTDVITALGYTPANGINYVPYTGATAAVNLGNNDLTSRYVVANGSGGLGGVISIKQDATYLAKGNGYSSIASSFTAFDFYGYTGASTYKNFTFIFNGLTDNTRRDYTLPDASGTLALTSDIPSLTGYVPTSRTLTINGVTYDLTTDRSWTVSPSVNATNTQDYTATAGQTVFTVIGGYTVGQLAVFYNGSKLSSAEFTAINGTSFTLATAAQVGDVLQAVVSVTGGGIGGSGTTNYIPKWTASGVLGDSIMYINGTDIGINTNTPDGDYHVKNAPGSDYYEINYDIAQGTGSDGTIYDYKNLYNYQNKKYTFYRELSTSGDINIFYHPAGYIGQNGNSTYVMHFDTGYDTATKQTLKFQLNGLYKISAYENGEVALGPDEFYDDGTYATTYPAKLRGAQAGQYASNMLGGHLYLQGGRSKGTGVPGDVIIQTGIQSATSGNTLNPALDRVTIKGGTGDVILTGPLSGTSATFVASGTYTNFLIGTTSTTGAIVADANRSNLILGAGTSNKIVFNNASTTQNGYIYSDSAELSLGYPASGTFNIQKVGVGNVLSIASTGAATFSSSVTANNDIISKNNSSNVSYLSFQRYSNTQQYTYLVGNAEPSGYLAMHTNDTERMRITSAGQVLINTSTEAGNAYNLVLKGGSGDYLIQMSSNNGSYQSDVYQDSGNGFLYFRNGSCATYLPRTAGNWVGNSDKTIKENLVKIPNALDKLSKINGYYYNLIDDKKNKLIGVIAQEVNEVLPEVVHKSYSKTYEREILGVEYSTMIPLLINAIQEQQAQIEELKNK